MDNFGQNWAVRKRRVGFFFTFLVYTNEWDFTKLPSLWPKLSLQSFCLQSKLGKLQNKIDDDPKTEESEK